MSAAPTQLGFFGGDLPKSSAPAQPTSAPVKRAARQAAPVHVSRTWKTALGISVGDLVRTSYYTGPYEVWDIYGPRWWETNYSGREIYLWQAPVISLRGVLPGAVPHGETDFFYLDTIYQIGEQWITAGGDGIYVQPGGRRGQAALAAATEPWPRSWEVPYRRIDGVDYEDRGRVFTCWTGDGPGQPGSVRCCDFNGDREVAHRSMGRVWGAARCPRCGRPVTREIFVMQMPEPREAAA